MEHEVDFSYEIENVARYRINAFQQRGVISLVSARSPIAISSIEELSLPEGAANSQREERGIVLLDRYDRLG